MRKILDSIKPHFTEGKLKKMYPAYDAFETFLFVPNHTSSTSCHVRESVDLKLGWNVFPDKGTILIQLPAFLVVLLAIAIGFILGSLSEFFRGHKFRIDHRKSVKDLSKISSELKEMKSQKKSQKEELLSLIK